MTSGMRWLVVWSNYEISGRSFFDKTTVYLRAYC